ncbi:MAG TPA: putative lipid II flippase FtsW [Streptosporangiaceae bacterium]|nr:putative lipid II flippase FtsW [Streptosporangiaceae bacterium]
MRVVPEARRASTVPEARRASTTLDRPLASYRLIVGCTGLLLAIGLVMVLSTSSASQLDHGSSPYSVFVKQLIGALVGLPMIWLLSRTPPRVFRRLARPLMWVAIAGLVLVLPFGTTVNGAERWISVAGILIQPSEFAKLALLLWGADLLARKDELKQLNDWRTLLMPLLPGAAVLCLLVMLGDDLGTTFLLLVILLTLLWVLGTPGRLFACMLGLILFALLMLVVIEPYRANRLTGFLNQSGSSPTGSDQQSIQGKWAIGSGGLFGVGLGDSKQKWGWVPNASSDFIFAILGEELGLIGTVCVVFLYGGLAYAGLRVARRMTEPFTRLAAAGITVWIVVQALVNICAVVGLLPITGVPLPLMSQGLSSLLVTMAAIGVLLSLARQEVGAKRTPVAARSTRQRHPPSAAREPVARRSGVRGPRRGSAGGGSRGVVPPEQHGGGSRGVVPPQQDGARRGGAKRSEV